MSLKNKLNRMKNHIVREEKDRVQEIVHRAPEFEEPMDIPYLDEWKKMGVTPYYFDGEFCLIREVKFPLNHLHGKYELGDLHTSVQMWNNSEIDHPLSSKGMDSSDLFFFDTETTGLGGGAGNTIFLLGYAQVKEDEVILKQHILPEPGNEIPFYQSFLENVDYTTLVTYNGKAFDWPQVKTRHTLIRDHVPNLPAFGHFDLFHGARRMWKHKLDRVKLINVEADILDFHRKDDVPGYLAPMIYFDFVDRKNPEGIIKVLEHNELDILSLISLYIHLTCQIIGVDSDQSDQERLLVGKWFDYLGDGETAIKLLEKVSYESEEPEAVEAKFKLAFHYKKMKRFNEAGKLWGEVVIKGSLVEVQMALIELAKIYEHQFKDFVKAFEYTNQALELEMKEAQRSEKKLLELDKRLKRIKKKLQKGTKI
ncbi:ribonuclease H-like domain-containing protein [Falsibacillus albus]|uniref:YprB ribonuclease H-like domain-containing protein n=1 Tax=Falsibacillus albus TaxID=2478915 RepID=A0A3L7JY06_9BACI|nr:ribonuclease H-like domain-containing protein [Falsibacillus albus]RLQ95144.1 hypothetical protein D9X91_11640 [Falsibacillus albus]